MSSFTDFNILSVALPLLYLALVLFIGYQVIRLLINLNAYIAIKLHQERQRMEEDNRWLR